MIQLTIAIGIIGIILLISTYLSYWFYLFLKYRHIPGEVFLIDPVLNPWIRARARRGHQLYESMITNVSKRYLYFSHLVQKHGNTVDHQTGTMNNGTVKVQFGTRIIVIISSRDDMKQMLVKNSYMFNKIPYESGHLEVFNSTNVLAATSDTNMWDMHRSMANSALSNPIFLQFLHQVVSEEFDKMITSSHFHIYRLQQLQQQQQQQQQQRQPHTQYHSPEEMDEAELLSDLRISTTPVNISQLIRKLTLNVMGKAMFDYDMEQFSDNNDLATRLAHMVTIITDRMRSASLSNSYFLPDVLWKLLPFGRPHKVMKNVNRFRALIEGVIERKERELRDRDESNEPDIIPPFRNSDMISLMLEKRRAVISDNRSGKSKHRKSIPFSNEDIVSNCFAFIYAGKDTVSAAIEWAIYHLCKYPDIQRRLHVELDKHLGTSRPTYVQLKNMECEYLEAFIKESLRLKSPVVSVQRMNTKDLVLDSSGIVLPARTHIYGSILDRHLGEDFTVPLMFDPNRFLLDSHYQQVHTSEHHHHQQQHLHKYKSCEFIPFSAGVRDCIGRYFAMTQIRYVIARLMQEYTVTMEHPEDIPDLVKFNTSTPGQELMVRFEKRTWHESRMSTRA